MSLCINCMRQQIHYIHFGVYSCYRKGHFPMTKMVFVSLYKRPYSPNTIRWPTVFQVKELQVYHFSIRPCSTLWLLYERAKMIFVFMSIIIHILRAIPIVFIMIQQFLCEFVFLRLSLCFYNMNKRSFITHFRHNCLPQRRERKCSICLHIVEHFLLKC